MKMRVFVLFLVLCLLPVAVLAQSGAGYEMVRWAVDGGGTTGGGAGGYSLGGTAGQPDAGVLDGGAYTLRVGFWAGLAPPENPHSWIYLPIVLR